jgi:hypothetical protein
MNVDTDIDVAIPKAVQELVKQRFAKYRLKRVDVRAGEDHTGDPSLFIDAHFGLSDTPLDTSLVMESFTEIREARLKMGEKRFPYVRHHFHDDQAVAKRKR